MKKQFALLVSVLVIALILIWIVKKQTKDELFSVMAVPEFELINQDNEVITNQDMLGKVYVVEFFFRNCPNICPVMNQNLKVVSDEFEDDDFGVIAITIDPKRDTVEALKQYKSALNINNPDWHFVTSERDYIYSLSEKFNIFVGEDYATTEGLEHSGKVALVDKNGMIRSRYNSNGMPILYYSALNYDSPKGGKENLKGKYQPEIDWLKEDIKKLLND